MKLTYYPFITLLLLSSLTKLFRFFLLVVLKNHHTNSLLVNRLGNYFKTGKIQIIWPCYLETSKLSFALPTIPGCASTTPLTQNTNCVMTSDVSGATQSMTSCLETTSDIVWYSFTPLLPT